MKAELKYALIPIGIYQGFPSITVRPGTEDCNLTQLIVDIITVTDDFNIKTKVVVFDSRNKQFDNADIAELLSLIDTMKRKGYMVMFMINGEFWPSYVQVGGYIIAECKEVRALHDAVNEFHLKGYDGLPQADGDEELNATYKYVHGHGVVKREDCLRFLLQTKTFWGLAAPVTQIEGDI